MFGNKWSTIHFHPSAQINKTYLTLIAKEIISANALLAFTINRNNFQGGSPGLVIMGRDSRSKGRGFESRHLKNCNDVCLKRPKINETDAGVGP